MRAQVVRLTDLDPQFYVLRTEVETWTRQNPDGSREQVTGTREHYEPVATLAEAQGIMFLCPKCFSQNGGPIGTHRVMCWFADRGVPDEADPKPGRWIPAGTGYRDLSFVGPAAASVALMGGCNWHGFIRNGEVTTC